MPFHITYRNQICSDIAAITYHLYKKGVVDGSESGDEWAVRNITESENITILSEFSQKSIDFNILCEFIQSQFSYIKPKAIHHWFFKVSGSYTVKKSIVMICYEYYKLGLLDGLKTGKNGTQEFIDARKRFALIGGKRKGEEQFLAEIKMTAVKMQVDGVEMEKFINFVASTIRKRTDYYFKIKNGLK